MEWEDRRRGCARKRVSLGVVFGGLVFGIWVVCDKGFVV